MFKAVSITAQDTDGPPPTAEALQSFLFTGAGDPETCLFVGWRPDRNSSHTSERRCMWKATSTGISTGAIIRTLRNSLFNAGKITLAAQPFAAWDCTSFKVIPIESEVTTITGLRVYPSLWVSTETGYVTVIRQQTRHKWFSQKKNF